MRNLDESKLVNIVYGGDKGYSVELPDTSLERCPECLSFEHWELKDVESLSSFENKFIFKCINKYVHDGVECDCSGECVLLESED